MDIQLEKLSSFDRMPKEGKYSYMGKKVILDLYTTGELYYEVTINKVEGKLRLGAKEVPLSQCEAVFPGWFLYGSVLRSYQDELDWKWVELVYPEGKIVEPTFLKTLEKEVRGMPPVVWKERAYNPGLEALPILYLKDRTGAFADLWMDYGEAGKVAVHDDVKHSWRSSALEKTWEKDLLETGFTKKIVGDTHYYCHLDEVPKSLGFLLELGWTIYDHQNRKLFRQGNKQLSLDSLGNKIIIKGSIEFDTYKAEVKDVIGAFNRKQSFISLSDDAVGLIAPDSAWEEFEVEEVGATAKKSHFSLLEPLLSDQQVTKEATLLHLLDQLKKNPTIEHTFPKDTFKGVLYPYQQEGLNWLCFLKDSGFHGLLADEMGLGKTVQVLSFLSLLELAKPVLVVAPTSLLFNWKNEFQKFLPSFHVTVYSGPHREINANIIITSYALLRQDADLFHAIDFQCAVLDEAQVIKNPDSQVARAAYKLKADIKLAITGTPIENSLDDLKSIFNYLMPDLLDKKMLENKKAIRPFILRRKKEEVGLDLPDKIEQTVWVEMTAKQQAYYDDFLIKTKKGLIRKIEEEGIQANRMEILEAILRLRQICCHPHLIEEKECDSGKYDQLLNDLEEIIAGGHKVLVYSQFTSMLKLIEKALQEKNLPYLYLDGSTKDRESIVSRFQETQGPMIFLISLKAGGVGLNLTAADYVFLYDPWWNEAVEAQAIDRAHRVGRKSTVIARRYVTVSSIEEKIMKMKAHKTALAKGMLDFEGEIDQISMQDLYELLSSSISS